MMKTRTLNYVDEVLSLLEDVMLYGGRQFQAAYHEGTQQWAVSYPPGIMPDDEEWERANLVHNEDS